MEGAVKPDDTICLMSTGREFTVTEVGYFRPGQYAPCDGLLAGDVGYIAASIKMSGTRRSATPSHWRTSLPVSRCWLHEGASMVFCGIYPADGAKYNDLRMREAAAQ